MRTLAHFFDNMVIVFTERLPGVFRTDTFSAPDPHYNPDGWRCETGFASEDEMRGARPVTEQEIEAACAKINNALTL